MSKEKFMSEANIQQNGAPQISESDAHKLDLYDGIPTHDEVDTSPPVKPRIEFVDPGSVKEFYELPAMITIAKPDDFVRNF